MTDRGAVGWAILSTGRHADHKMAPAIRAVPDARLVAVWSRDRARAEAFAERHQALAAHDDLDVLLTDSRVDAVLVASPNAFHADHARRAARAGKHVLVEKPMATTAGEALEMVRAARRAGVALGVGFHLRHHPAHRAAREVLASGALGRPVLAQAQWGYGTRGPGPPRPRPPLEQWWEDPALLGGAAALMGTGVHAIDLLRFVLQREVIRVMAAGDGQTAAQPLETVMAVNLLFEGNLLGTVCCGRQLPDSRNDLHLYGSGGRLSGLATLSERREGALEVVTGGRDERQRTPRDPLANYVDEIADFQEALRAARDPAASGLDGLRVVEITDAAIASARGGRAVPVRRHAV